jgi:hypothetical protein
MKMKHNKKRNTAFLYESLITELTKSIVKKDDIKKNTIIEIIKKYFSNGSDLKSELNLYRSILESESMKMDFSKKLIAELKKDFENLNRKEVFNSQTKLINEMNKNFSNSIFANFISNYKNIASVGQFFNSTGLDAKRRLIVEEKVLGILTTKKESKKETMKHIDNLTYKTFTKTFNETYDKTLRPEQKDLLTNYITSFSDNGLGLKSFLNEEIGRLKGKIQECMSEDKIKNNDTYLQNTSKISQKLDSYKNKKITEEVVKEVFYIQDLVSEVLK